MDALIRSDPRDVSPSERLRRFRQEMAEVDTAEESVKVLRRYLDPDPIVYKGKVTRATDEGVEVIPWQRSHFGYHRPGTIPRNDATPLEDLRGEHFSHARVPLKRAPANGMEFKHPLPRKRAPLERVESLTKRFVAEWKRGNEGVLKVLLAELCAQYWKAGMPVTEDALRMLAAESLRRSGADLKDQDGRRVTRTWTG